MDLGSCTLEQLGTAEHERLKALRLRALADAPTAFGTKLADAVTWSAERWCQSLEGMVTFVAVSSAAATLEATVLGTSMDVGMVRCVLHPEANTASLVSLWVAPEARRAGVAGRLIEAVTAFARRNKMGRVVLDVVETNSAAVALYRKHGFVPNGERIVFPESCQGMAERQFELLL